jgi:hypothetical protein
MIEDVLRIANETRRVHRRQRLVLYGSNTYNCPVLLQHCKYRSLGFPTTGQGVVAIEVFRRTSVGWNSMILCIVKAP